MRLADFAVPHLDVILEELFHVPPAALFPEEPRPATVEELAARARLGVDEVRKRFMDLEQLAKDIEITVDELQARLGEQPVLLDVRQPWEYEICHLPGSILLTEESFMALKPRLAAAPLVVAVCHHGVRSYSAAMYLRSQGVASARSLAGGVELWAQRIDPSMPRY